VLKNKAAQLGLDVHHQGGFGSGFDAEGDIEFSTDYLGKDLVKAAKHCLHLQEVFATLLNDYERSMSAIGIGDGFKETTVVVRLVSPDVDGTNGMDLAYWDGLQEIIAGTVDLKELLRRTETGDVI
jgi:hypothetical protein